MRIAVIFAIMALLVLALFYFTPPTATDQPPVLSENLQPSPPVAPITSPLEALMQQQPQLAMKLLEKNTPVDETNRFGDTALTWAANLHQLELLNALLERGANPNHRGSMGRTALHWAAKSTDAPSCEALLDHGAKADIEDDRGETPLFHAARANDAKLVGLLLERGAPLEHRDRKGDTALACAVRVKAKDAIERLLLAGANSQQNIAGGTILSVALELGLGNAFKTPELQQEQPELSRELEQTYREVIQNPADKPALDIPQLAQQIHQLVNQQRLSQGLKELTYDLQLEKLAIIHSKDMSARAFFSHVNPDGETPTTRADRLGVATKKSLGDTTQYGVAENIYRASIFSGYATTFDGTEKQVTMNWYTAAQLADMAVKGWMNSPGHRRNILTPQYTQEGIGIFVDEKGSFHVTQNLF